MNLKPLIYMVVVTIVCWIVAAVCHMNMALFAILTLIAWLVSVLSLAVRAEQIFKRVAVAYGVIVVVISLVFALLHLMGILA